MIIFDPNGTSVTLGQKLGGGGEAEIFDTPDRLLVAKVYRSPTRFRESKLLAMIASTPHDPTLHLGHPSICWPKSLLFDQAGTCIGFLMHRVDVSTHVPAFKLYNPMDRQVVSLSITWKYLVRTATNIAAAVEAIHAQGHVIGDFNESNILVANNALVTLVDCDSMQVRDPVNGICFRCTVGKPDFTPPELQGCEFSKVDRCFAHDNFGLAIIIFLLLMEGVHPFNGVWQKPGNPPVLEDRIRNNLSPYAAHPDVAFMPAAPPFDLLPQEVRSLFMRCFRDGHGDPSLRPAPSEWKTALTGLEENLLGCSESDRHFYSNHLAACPWCERRAVLQGIDPFPIQVQRIVHKPPAGQILADARDIRLKVIRPTWHHPLLRRAAVVLVLAIISVILWRLVRTPARQLWSAIDVASILHPKPVLKLSPLLLCTGVDSNGVPVGVSDSFSQDQLLDPGVMAFLTYAGATPQKTTFQFRWTIEDRTYESPVHTFESAADVLYLKFGNDLPAGYHKVEFLADGKVQREVAMVIQPVATRRSRRGDSPQKAPPVLIGESSTSPAEKKEQIIPPISEVPAPLTLPEKREERAEPQTQTPLNVVSYQAKHRHTIGSCSGELQLKPQSIEFTSERHTFRFDIKDVQVYGDGVEDPSGKAWHFIIQGTNIELLLSKWKHGELFPASFRTEEPVVRAARESPPSAVRVYNAKHKHRLGSCSGELQLTPEHLEFSSRQHYVKYALGKVQVDGDGIQDSVGRTWRFDIPGEDVRSLLRLWKTGKLFQNAAP